MGQARRRSEPDGVFRGTEALAEGALTLRELRSSRVVRLFRDVYVGAATDVDHRLRCEAAAPVMPQDAVLTGRSAATVLGLELAARNDPVEIVVDESSRFGPVRGLLVKRTALRLGDWRPGPFCRIATPARIGFDLGRRPPVRRAVADLDRAVAARVVDLASLHRYLSRHEHGVVGARQAAGLVDPRAESGPESELRVILRQAGLAVTPQVVVTDGRGLVARVDLAVDGALVAIEYDGAWHALREQLERDRARMRRLRDAGWEVVHVTAAELRGDPRVVVEAVQRAIARASCR